ncbi:alpha/beta fold hydrolase [Nocardia thailandica]
MQVFHHQGNVIAFDEAGAGRPIVFLHNLGGDRRIWQAQFEALRATNRVFALDLLGYGDSDAPRSGYTLETYVSILGAFLEELELRDVTLVGHCFGSAVSLLYTRERPERISALVLSSPLTAATLRPTRTGKLALLGPLVNLDRVLARVSVPAPLARRIVGEQFGTLSAPESGRLAEHLTRRWTERRRLMVTAAISRELPRLAALDDFVPGADFPPITTVWGARNRVLSAEAGARLNRTLRPVREIVVPDAGHLVMAEAPDTVIEAVRDALCGAPG